MAKLSLSEGIILLVLVSSGLGLNRQGGMMKKSTKLRLFGGAVLIFNLWLIGRYNLSGIPVLLLTFGFAIGFEFLVVRPSSKEKGGIKE